MSDLLASNIRIRNRIENLTIAEENKP